MSPALQEATVHSRYYATAEGISVPLDPVSGEALQAGEIPKSLLADPELAQGYDFLYEHSYWINAKLILTGHDSANDLAEAGIDLTAEAKDLASADGVLFLEGTATENEKALLQRLLNHITTLSGEKAEQMAQEIRSEFGVDPFRAESYSQLVGTQVEVAQPDYEKDSDRPADRQLAEWSTVREEMLKNPSPTEEDIENYALVNLGFTIYRDWYLVGKIGSYLAKRHAARGAALDDGVVIGVLAGSLHANIGKHLEALGIPVTYIGETPDKLAPVPKRFVAAVGGATISKDM